MKQLVVDIPLVIAASPKLPFNITVKLIAIITLKNTRIAVHHLGAIKYESSYNLVIGLFLFAFDEFVIREISAYPPIKFC